MGHEAFRPFQSIGLAALSDLDSATWVERFTELEPVQAEFLSKEHLFRSPRYRWPSDTLHACLRVWEYPFVYGHLSGWLEARSEPERPVVVDLGSGVTFFPVALARKGCNLITVDLDGVCEEEFAKIANVLDPGPGTIRFQQGDAKHIPLPDNSVDCLYSISVLEHIPDPHEVVYEMARVLRPRGLLILTFDVDLKGNFELSARNMERLTATLRSVFELAHPERTVHPMDMLTSDNSPYPLYKNTSKSRIRRMLSPLKQAILIRDRLLVTTYGAVYTKK